MKFRNDAHFKGEIVFTMNGTAAYLGDERKETGLLVYAPLAIFIARGRHQLAQMEIVPAPAATSLDEIRFPQSHLGVQ